MVEYVLDLNAVFGSLADPTRRDILRQLLVKEMSVSEIAANYTNLSLAAVSKHLKVLERAKLILKRRQGKNQYVRISPTTLADASKFLAQYQKNLESSWDSLEQYLNKEIK